MKFEVVITENKLSLYRSDWRQFDLDLHV